MPEFTEGPQKTDAGIVAPDTKVLLPGDEKFPLPSSHGQHTPLDIKGYQARSTPSGLVVADTVVPADVVQLNELLKRLEGESAPQVVTATQAYSFKELSRRESGSAPTEDSVRRRETSALYARITEHLQQLMESSVTSTRARAELKKYLAEDSFGPVSYNTVHERSSQLEGFKGMLATIDFNAFSYPQEKPLTPTELAQAERAMGSFLTLVADSTLAGPDSNHVRLSAAKAVVEVCRGYRLNRNKGEKLPLSAKFINRCMDTLRLGYIGSHVREVLFDALSYAALSTDQQAKLLLIASHTDELQHFSMYEYAEQVVEEDYDCEWRRNQQELTNELLTILADSPQRLINEFPALVQKADKLVALVGSHRGKVGYEFEFVPRAKPVLRVPIECQDVEADAEVFELKTKKQHIQYGPNPPHLIHMQDYVRHTAYPLYADGRTTGSMHMHFDKSAHPVNDEVQLVFHSWEARDTPLKELKNTNEFRGFLLPVTRDNISLNMQTLVALTNFVIDSSQEQAIDDPAKIHITKLDPANPVNHLVWAHFVSRFQSPELRLQLLLASRDSGVFLNAYKNRLLNNVADDISDPARVALRTELLHGVGLVSDSDLQSEERSYDREKWFKEEQEKAVDLENDLTRAKELVARTGFTQETVIALIRYPDIADYFIFDLMALYKRQDIITFVKDKVEAQLGRNMGRIYRETSRAKLFQLSKNKNVFLRLRRGLSRHCISDETFFRKNDDKLVKVVRDQDEDLIIRQTVLEKFREYPDLIAKHEDSLIVLFVHDKTPIYLRLQSINTCAGNPDTIVRYKSLVLDYLKDAEKDARSVVEMSTQSKLYTEAVCALIQDHDLCRDHMEYFYKALMVNKQYPGEQLRLIQLVKPNRDAIVSLIGVKGFNEIIHRRDFPAETRKELISMLAPYPEAVAIHKKTLARIMAVPDVEKEVRQKVAGLFEDNEELLTEFAAEYAYYLKTINEPQKEN